MNEDMNEDEFLFFDGPTLAKRRDLFEAIDNYVTTRIEMYSLRHPGGGDVSIDTVNRWTESIKNLKEAIDEIKMES